MCSLNSSAIRRGEGRGGERGRGRKGSYGVESTENLLDRSCILADLTLASLLYSQSVLNWSHMLLQSTKSTNQLSY